MKDEIVKFEVTSVDDTSVSVEEIRFRQIEGGKDGISSFVLHETRKSYRGNFERGDIVALTIIETGKAREARHAQVVAQHAAREAQEKAEEAVVAVEKSNAELAEAQAKTRSAAEAELAEMEAQATDSRVEHNDSLESNQQQIATTETNGAPQRSASDKSSGVSSRVNRKTVSSS